MTEFISCQRVVKVYRVSGHELVALRGIDFTMERGEMVAIIGPSGAGKSSLLNLLGGLDTPTAGQLIVDGLDLLTLKPAQIADYRLKRVGFIWQQVERNLFGYRTALQNVTLPMMMAGISPRERRSRALELLEAVGLADQALKRPSAMSGGQQQRVALAVALANRPPMLLADEPTGALDRKSAEQAVSLLNDLRGKFGLTVLMVTHDMAIAEHADRVLTLRDGALGQDFSHEADESMKLDDGGRIQLPESVRGTLRTAQRISVEIRPEGVLLRPETDVEDEGMSAYSEVLPQDAPPEKRRWWQRGRKKAKAS
jgi:ABC-type lipoprotein export system ATPase subunit